MPRKGLKHNYKKVQVMQINADKNGMIKRWHNK